MNDNEKLTGEVVDTKEKVIYDDDYEYDYELAEEGRQKVKATNLALLAIAVILGCGVIFSGLKKSNNKNKDVNNDNTTTTYEEDYNELNDEVINNDVLESASSVTTTDSKNVTLEDLLQIGGSFIDNHNQELYISSKKELELHDKGNTIDIAEEKNSSTQSKNKSKSSNTSNSTSIVQPTPTVEPQYIAPDGNIYVDSNVNNGYIYIESNPFEYAPSNEIYIPDNNGNNYVETEPDIAPEVSVKYEGYVLRKLNFEKNGLWYTPYISGSEIVVDSFDISMAGDGHLDPHNSNVFGLSSTKEVPGWEYIADNSEEYQFLDSVTNLESAINSVISAQEAYRQEAENSYGLSK